VLREDGESAGARHSAESRRGEEECSRAAPPLASPLPKRVLMTADPLGGVWTYALELANALAQHGIEVCLATMGAPLTEKQHAELKGLPNTELCEGHFRLEWMEDPWNDVSAAGHWLLN